MAEVLLSLLGLVFFLGLSISIIIIYEILQIRKEDKDYV